MTSYYLVITIVFVSIIAKAFEGTQAQSPSYTVELIGSSPVSVAPVGTHWDEECQSLYYVDQFRTDACTILRYCQPDNKTYCATVDGYPFVTFIIPVKGTRDKFAVGSNKSVEIIQWDGKSPKAKWVCTVFVAENCTEFQSNVFNDAHADRYGRLFIGTRRYDVCSNLDSIPTYGNLFRISADEPPVTLNKPNTIRFADGMGFDEQRNKYYFIDSCDWNIKSFDYCPYTGDLCGFFFDSSDTFTLSLAIIN